MGVHQRSHTLAAVFKAAPFGVFVIDAEGTIVYVNPRQSANSQLSPDGLIGMHYRTKFYTTLESQGLLGPYDRLQQEGTPFSVTLPRYHRHSDKRQVSFSIRGYKYQEYTLLFTAIEEALEAQQGRYEQLFENANDGIFLLDRQARFVAVNREFAEMIGLSKAEIIGQTTDLLLPGRFAQSLERLEQIIQDGSFGPYELETVTPLGKKVLSLNAFAFFEGTTPVGGMNIARDVTDEHRQRQERKALHQLADSLARSSDVYTIVDHLFVCIQDLLGADYGFVMLTDAEKSELRGVAAYGIDSEEFCQERIELGADQEPAPAVVAFQTRQPVVVTDMATSPLVSARLRKQYEGTKSSWAVPLMNGDEAVGIFAVGYASSRQATKKELQFLQHLGNEAALAIERTRLTSQIQEEEERYRSLFENASDAIMTFTLDGTITAVNRVVEAITGRTREELVGQHYATVCTPDSARLGQDYTRAALRGEKRPPIFEAEFVCKDGRVVPIECRTRLTYDKQGRPVGMQGTYRDITERKRAEAALRQSEEYFRALIENTSDLITVANADGIVRYQSPSIEHYFGYKPEELTGKNAFELFHQDDMSNVRRAFGQALQNPGELVSLELRMRHRDGSWRLLAATLNNLLDHPAVAGVVVNSHDITERRQMEEERGRFFSLSLDMLAIAGFDGYFRRINPAFEKASGFTSAEILSKPFIELFHPEDRAATRAEVQKLASGTPTLSFENRFRCKDGSYNTDSS